MPQYGYTTAGGEEISPFIDMINGGGPGRSGERFEGGGIMSLLANLVASPYGSQRQRPGHPAPGTMGVSRGASGGGFQSQLPGEDLMGGTGDEGGAGDESDMGGAGFDPSYYSDLVPLSEEEHALLVGLPDRLVPSGIRDALPGDPVPRSALLELRGALLGDTDMRQTTPYTRATVPSTASTPPPSEPTVVDLPVPGSDTPPVPGTPPSISELTGAGLGQGMASPMDIDEGLDLIGDQTYSGIPAPYTMASESFPMPTQNLSVYEMSEIAALMDVLRGQNPTASEEEIQNMAIREIVSRR